MPTGMNENFSAGTLRNEPFDFNSLLGPISKGLGMASGVFGGLNMLQASGSYRSQARQYESMAGQALEQGFQTGIDLSREGTEVLGEMTAAFGKQGSLLEGSPLLVLADTTADINRNVARAIEQGRIDQQAYLRMAKQAKKAAKGSKLGGIIKIAGAAAAPFTGGASLGLTAAQWGS